MKSSHKAHSHSEWKKTSMMTCDAVDDICKDLDRTLPEYEIFQTEEGYFSFRDWFYV